MSIVKGLLLIFLFLILLYKYIKLHKHCIQEREYFIKTLNHDLKVSTLAQIRGLELLEKTQELSLVSDINDSCKYTLDMITMLLNTYRFENGEQILEYDVFNLSELLFSNYKKLINFTTEKNLKFYTRIKSEDLINADKQAMSKLLYNLLSTASFYADKNSNIVSTIKRNEDNLEVSIRYCGRALSEEECRRMFSNKPRFSTVGHGIKMQLCKKIIDFHGGEIFVNNCDANINMFSFKLPINKKQKRIKHTINNKLQLNIL